MKDWGAVLLLGGTGAMGRYLAPLLAEQGYRVDVTTRSNREAENDAIRFVKGNAKDTDWIAALATENQYDAIVDFMMYSTPEFAKVSKGLLGLTPQYFYLSSYRAYADCAGKLNEDCPRKVDCSSDQPRLASDHYGMNKGRQENILFDSGRDDWTIIRPTMTFASNRFQFVSGDNFDIVRSVRGLPSIIPDSLADTPNTLTYGKDVALMISRLIGNEGAFGQAFHTATGDNRTWRGLAKVYAAVFGSRHVVVSREDYVAAVGSDTPTFMDREFRRDFDSSKLLAVTGLNPSDFIGLEDGLREAWNESDPSRFLRASGALEAHTRIDRLTNTAPIRDKLPKSLRKIYSLTGMRTQLMDELNVDVSGFRVTAVNDRFWKIMDYEGAVLLKRTRKSVKIPGNKWVSFRVPSLLAAGTKYLLVLDVECNMDCVGMVFIHDYGERAQIIEEKVSFSTRRQTVKLPFTSFRNNQYVGITATNFPDSQIELVLYSMSIERWDDKEGVSIVPHGKRVV